MKYVFFAAALLVQAPLHAATWTVDNNPARPANFQSLQEAIDEASPGDTLLIAGSDTAYGNITLPKRLILRGSGYFPENNVGGASAAVARLGTLALTQPSESLSASGSQIEGLEISGSTNVNAGVSNALFRRVRFAGNATFNGAACMVVQSYFDSAWFTVKGANCVIANSRISGAILEGTGITVEHCVILASGAPTFSNLPTIRHSIFVSAEAGGNGVGYTYSGAALLNCLAIGNRALPGGNGNASGFASADVFQGGSSTDSQYLPKQDSPALGAGLEGVDLGMFGGATPYVLSGIPALPRITTLRAPAVAPDSTGLTFEIDVEARD